MHIHRTSDSKSGGRIPYTLFGLWSSLIPRKRIVWKEITEQPTKAEKMKKKRLESLVVNALHLRLKEEEYNVTEC